MMGNVKGTKQISLPYYEFVFIYIYIYIRQTFKIKFSEAIRNECIFGYANRTRRLYVIMKLSFKKKHSDVLDRII